MNLDHDFHLPMIRIRTAASAAFLAPSSLRTYETLGLVLPHRDRGGQRLYSKSDISWLQALQEHFRTTRTGPQCTARLLGKIPYDALIGTQGYSSACREHGYDPRDSAGTCWLEYGLDGPRRRDCRDCPAYQKKDTVLKFRQNFVIVQRAPSF